MNARLPAGLAREPGWTRFGRVLVARRSAALAALLGVCLAPHSTWAQRVPLGADVLEAIANVER